MKRVEWNSVLLSPSQPDPERTERLATAAQYVDACQRELGYYRCTVLDAVIEYAHKRLIEGNRSWHAQAPRSDRYDVFNGIWKTSGDSLPLSAMLPVVDTREQQLGTPVQAQLRHRGGKRKRASRVFVATDQARYSQDDVAYLQRVSQLIESAEKGVISGGTIRSEVGVRVSELQAHAMAERAKRLTRATLHALCIPLAFALLFRSELVGVLVLAALAVLGWLYLCSYDVVRNHPEAYAFVMPLLESQFVPRTAAILSRGYNVLLRRAEKLLAWEEQREGLPLNAPVSKPDPDILSSLPTETRPPPYAPF